MLTRKHYKLIAKAIYEAGWQAGDSRNNIITSLSTTLKQDNPRFNPGRFEEACITGKGVS
jgi:hypothetical protein